MKPIQTVLLAIVLSIVASYATVKSLAPAATAPGATTPSKKESHYDRVMRTRTFRCAYTPYPPFLIKDANNGKLSGVYFDAMEEAGKRLNIKIEWPEEVSPAGMFAGFAADRYDGICAGYTRNPGRATQGDFSVPMFYYSYSIFVRADDTRFDADQKVLNDPKYSFTTIDGELANFIIAGEFPKAKMNSLPEGALSDTGVRLINVSSGKSDATIIETAIGEDYMRANPGKLKPLEPPVNIYPSNVILPNNDMALKDMIDAAITNLHETHFIAKVIRKYTSGKGYYAPAETFNPKDLSE